MGEGDDLLVRLTLGLLDDTSRWLAMGKRLGLPQEGRGEEKRGAESLLVWWKARKGDNVLLRRLVEW